MRLIGHWDQELAQLGNKPGLNEGAVVIELAVPVAGSNSITADSTDLAVGAEGGQVVGLFVTLDGRRLFIPWSNVTGIIDAPAG
jgi:hypothetical protein